MDQRKQPGYDPKGKGETTVAVIIAELMKAGKSVLEPVGDNKRYDLVVDEDGRFITIQCKTGRYLKGCVEFRTCSNNWRTKKFKDYKGQIELFGVWCPEINKIYFVSVSAVGTSDAKLRIDPPKNGQKKNIRWAKDYEFTGEHSLSAYAHGDEI